MALRECGFFEHGRSCTLWLRPQADGERRSRAELQRAGSSPSAHEGLDLCTAYALHRPPVHPCTAGLLEAQAALERAFPQCTDLSSDPARGIQAFSPHLSLGQWRTRADVAAAAAELAAGWSPLSFQVGGVALLARRGFDDPFSLRYWVPFGGGAPVAAAVPYIATAGAAGGTAQQQPARGSSGSGGAGPAAELFGDLCQPDGTVWNFAFGANMCPRKLNGARGLHPVESAPACLPGHRLAFTHRGGFGTLVPLAGGEAGPAGLPAVHGVLHRLSAADYGRLACMEHEYL